MLRPNCQMHQPWASGKHHWWVMRQCLVGMMLTGIYFERWVVKVEILAVVLPWLVPMVVRMR